jgi:hypothetical protein
MLVSGKPLFHVQWGVEFVAEFEGRTGNTVLARPQRRPANSGELFAVPASLAVPLTVACLRVKKPSICKGLVNLTTEGREENEEQFRFLR